MFKNSAFNVVREQPLVEFPVTLEDAKSFLGINNDREDNFIKNLISISTEYAQWFMEKSLTKQTLHLSYSGEVIPRKIPLPFGPIISVKSVRAHTQSIDSKNYFLDSVRNNLVFLVCIRSTQVNIIYNAGYEQVSSIPAQVKYGILHHTAISYKNRNWIDVKHISFLKELYFPFRELRLVL